VHGIAIEDGIVLAEEIAAQPTLELALEKSCAPLRALPPGRGELGEAGADRK